MPITALDPQSALVVVDLQKGIVGLPGVHPIPEIVTRSAALAEAFRNHHLPVVLVNVVPKGVSTRTQQAPPLHTLPADFADLVPELNQQPSDLLITKHGWGALTGTTLEASLRDLGVTQIVLVGVSTSIGVESTARVAYQLGFNITLVTDAMTDLSLDAHNNSLTRIFPRLGELATTAEVLELLEKRSAKQ
jgi:nicotinamidase-related amidase